MNTTNNGGTMITTILFGLSFLMLVAAIVVYLLKDDTTTTEWANHTKTMITQNEKLLADWQNAVDMVKGLCDNHGTLAAELERQKHQLDKIEFGLTTQTKSAVPMKIEFEPIKVLSVTKPATRSATTTKKEPTKKKAVKKVTIKKKTNKKSYVNGATKPTPAQRKLMKKTSRQVRELSQ